VSGVLFRSPLGKPITQVAGADIEPTAELATLEACVHPAAARPIHERFF
jgi:hypothetical protein